jgi:hypothetical protein
LRNRHGWLGERRPVWTDRWSVALAAVAGAQDRVLARLTLGIAVLVQALFCIATWRIAA